MFSYLIVHPGFFREGERSEMEANWKRTLISLPWYYSQFNDCGKWYVESYSVVRAARRIFRKDCLLSLSSGKNPQRLALPLHAECQKWEPRVKWRKEGRKKELPPTASTHSSFLPSFILPQNEDPAVVWNWIPLFQATIQSCANYVMKRLRGILSGGTSTRNLSYHSHAPLVCTAAEW